MKEKTIDLLRQQQEVTRGATEWTMLEEEIQSLLDDKSQDDNCYKGLFWDHTTKTYKRWNELINTGTHNEKEDTSTTNT